MKEISGYGVCNETCCCDVKDFEIPRSLNEWFEWDYSTKGILLAWTNILNPLQNKALEDKIGQQLRNVTTVIVVCKFSRAESNHEASFAPDKHHAYEIECLVSSGHDKHYNYVYVNP